MKTSWGRSLPRLATRVRVISLFAALTLATGSDSLWGEIGSESADAARIAALMERIEQTEGDIESIRKDLLVKQQSEQELNGYIKEIQAAFQPPRPIEIEKELVEFERIRDDVRSDIRIQKDDVQLLEKKYDGLVAQVDALRRDQFSADHDSSGAFIEEEEEVEEMAATDKTIEDLLELTLEIEEDDFAVKDEADAFIKSVTEMRDKAQQNSDAIYERMHSRYVALTNMGYKYITPPRKPAGYDARHAARVQSAVAKRASGGGGPVYTRPGGAGGGGGGPKPLSEIEQLKQRIANTTDPEEKANLEQLLQSMESAQK